MKLAVIGSRNFNDYELLKRSINESFEDVTTIVSGGARGADSLGERYAKENGISTEIYLPNWDRYGKSAGYRRNVDIINNSDSVIAFWDGQSKGTKHSIDISNKAGKKVTIIKYA
jgi:hypothetical protein